jgi:hypothetical protein
MDNKQLGLASPLQSAASQSGQPITLELVSLSLFLL